MSLVFLCSSNALLHIYLMALMYAQCYLIPCCVDKINLQIQIENKSNNYYYCKQSSHARSDR